MQGLEGKNAFAASAFSFKSLMVEAFEFSGAALAKVCGCQDAGH